MSTVTGFNGKESNNSTSSTRSEENPYSILGSSLHIPEPMSELDESSAPEGEPGIIHNPEKIIIYIEIFKFPLDFEVYDRVLNYYFLKFSSHSNPKKLSNPHRCGQMYHR